MALIKKWWRRSSCGRQRRQQPRRTSQSRSQQGGLSGTKGLMIRKENVRRDTSLFSTSAVTTGTAAPSKWNVYFCQGIMSIFELFVVVPSEHLCDPPKRQLPQSDQRSRNRVREMVAFQVIMRGILGNGAVRRLGGCCCQLVPSWTTAIIEACVRKHGRDGSLTSFPSSSLVTAIEWPHSFILSGKKSLVSHLPAAFLPHAHLNLLKRHLFRLAACLRFLLPGLIFNPPDRQKQTNGRNWQNYIFQIIIFPSQGIYFKRPFCLLSFLNTTDPCLSGLSG